PLATARILASGCKLPLPNAHTRFARPLASRVAPAWLPHDSAHAPSLLPPPAHAMSSTSAALRPLPFVPPVLVPSHPPQSPILPGAASRPCPSPRRSASSSDPCASLHSQSPTGLAPLRDISAATKRAG